MGKLSKKLLNEQLFSLIGLHCQCKIPVSRSQLLNNAQAKYLEDNVSTLSTTCVFSALHHYHTQHRKKCDGRTRRKSLLSKNLKGVKLKELQNLQLFLFLIQLRSGDESTKIQLCFFFFLLLLKANNHFNLQEKETMKQLVEFSHGEAGYVAAGDPLRGGEFHSVHFYGIA